MNSIAILVPVLARGESVTRLTRSIRRTQEHQVPWSLLFLCSPGDDEGRTAVARVMAEYALDERIRVIEVPWEAGPGDWAKKINLGYRETTEDFMLLGATDLEFHGGWHIAALEVARQTGAGVIGTNDLGNATVMRGLHSTHPLVRRSYIDEYGTIDEEGKVLHEGYQHQWVDTELCETAKARGQWTFAMDSHVEHLHPFWRDRNGIPKSPMDKTYEKALSTPFEDNAIFKRRRPLWKTSSLHALRR
jgi:hypothetical protein